jgi:3-oxoacyl-[acyl-carrier-protein] synthase-1
VQPLSVNAYTLVSALGAGLDATHAALAENRSALAPNDFAPAPIACHVGRVRGLEDVRLPAPLGASDCRNNRLALLAMERDGFVQAVARAVSRYGAARVGVFVGTSTSGILSTELAYRHRDPHSGALPAGLRYAEVHNFGALGDFVAEVLGLRGPCMAISTACSSSAKVFASAQRSIAAGLCDAAVVGGVDTLCATTLYGFSSLQLVSQQPARPFDAARDGLSIGEAGGFALLTRDLDDVALLGYGETSDAHHMSSPHPEGAGAQEAMRTALARAHIEPAAIDYIHAHGTATRSNDSTEDAAVAAVFGPVTPVSSTKGAMGHTLGAAGIAGAVVALLAIRHGLIPGTANTAAVDPECRAQIRLRPASASVRRVLTNSFGFGGNNCSLVFGVRD